MKLMASTTSPFARKVRMILLEKKIPFEFIVDIPWNDDTQVPAHNPLGKVPVLILENGQNIFDSRVIVDYLEYIKPWPMMLPADAGEAIHVKQWEALADGIADAAAAIFLEKKRASEQQSAEWITRQELKMTRGLQSVNDLLKEDYCHGNTFSVADIALFSTLGYLELRFPTITWRTQYPKLDNFFARIAARESAQKTVPVV